MAFVEKRDLKTRPLVGEIVEVTWLDHFSFEGNRPAKKAVVARSWGRLDFEGEDGVALTHTAVVEQEPEFPVNSIHDGQFIVRSSMKEIKRANGHKK